MTKTPTPAAASVDTSNVHLSSQIGVADTALLQPDNLSPATKPEASGALQEPEIAERVDTKHPAVDDEPRKRMPKVSNRIDFNDPTITGAEAVEQNMKANAA